MGVKSQCKSGESEMSCPSLAVRQEEGGRFYLLAPFVQSRFSWMGWCPPTLEKAVCFTESIYSNASLIQKHLHRHSKKKMFNLGTLWLVKLIHKMNHHTGFTPQSKKASLIDKLILTCLKTLSSQLLPMWFNVSPRFSYRLFLCTLL